MRFRDRFATLKYVLFPLLGGLFILWYIRAAGEDVVYSDYIRLINEYLPDVTDFSKLLTPDILTRIPATFLARLVNVKSFSYSVTFDRILSAAGLVIMAGCISYYVRKHRVGFGWISALFIVLFSLNKWEILLNGTAWAHVVSFGLFFIDYLLLDKIWRGESDTKEEFALCLSPLFMILVAGEYIVSYACVMMLVCVMGMVFGGANSRAGKRERKLFRMIFVFSAAALLLYALSRHFAVWDHAGRTEKSFIEVLTETPSFFLRLFIKSFAGAVAGQETLLSLLPGGKPLPDSLIFILGALVLAAYVLAFALYFTSDMLEKTIFPLILLVSGFANHVLVVMARWIFLDENYAMSSRYSGQFMIGIIGIILIFAMYAGRKRNYRRTEKHKRAAINISILALTALILAGNCYTTYDEIRKAPYREDNYRTMTEAVLHYGDYSAEELSGCLEWHKDPESLYNALEILKDNRLNVFSRVRAGVP